MSRATTEHTELEGNKPLMLLKVRVPGHRSSISPLVQGLIQVIRETGCAEGREFAIEIALREALANAAVHGCENDPFKVVECSLECRESGEFIIVVRDPGPGFDPGVVPEPIMGENLYSNHGRGIYLIKQVADAVWFERAGREIHVVLRGGKRPPAASRQRAG